MMRWITSYIDVNTERWDAERKEGQDKVSQWITEWTEKTKQDKILEIRSNKTDQNQAEQVYTARKIQAEPLEQCSHVDSQGETSDQAEQGCRTEGPQAEPPEQSTQ